MRGFVRLVSRYLARKLSGKINLKIIESKYKELILFILSLLITIVFAYTLIYNLSDFPKLSGTQVVGVLILIPLLLLFFSGMVVYFKSALDILRSSIFGISTKIDENHPLYHANHLGKTIYEGREYDLYENRDNYFLYSNKKIKGLKRYKNIYLRYLERNEIGEVYRIDKHCIYKGYIFTTFRIYREKNKNEKVIIFTDDSSIGFNRDLGFTRIDKFGFEKIVPIEEVDIKEIMTLVDLDKDKLK